MTAELTINGVTWKSDKVDSMSTLQNILGFLPMFLSASDDDDAAAQFAKNYISGWNSFKGFKYDKSTHALRYPGDPPMKPVASATLRNETIMLYPYAWVAIIKHDGEVDIARLD